MDYASLPLFQVMKAKLNYLSDRQSVLAQNIANADTPGYQARDLRKPDFQKMIAGLSTGPGQVQMMRTSSGHITPQGSAMTSAQEIKASKTDELNPNGNNIAVEEEMAKIAENQGEYQKVISIYAKTVDMFRTAIGRPGGGA